MIITRLVGGLGNQLFQYAAGKALAHRIGVEFVVDRRSYFKNHSVLGAVSQGKSPRAFGLQHFAISARIGQGGELPPTRKNPLRYTLWKYLGGSPKRVKEQGLDFQPHILNSPDGSYLVGYWQSERYFEDACALIRKELTFAKPPSPPNAKIMEKINSGPSVSVHVRRGDYLNSSVSRICSPEYYLSGFEFLAAKTGATPQVFIFSDDPVWARENLKFPSETTVVDGNGEAQSFEDMRLMSACDHNIIAQSSFSWWGAWLNPNPDKVVVAPNLSGARTTGTDWVPNNWVRI